MKGMLSSVFAILMAIFSVSVQAADKVVITGSPVVLEQRGDVYYVPGDYKSTETYHYVTIGGTNRVCFAEAQPSLASLDLVLVDVQVGGERVKWNCYQYDTTHFEVK